MQTPPVPRQSLPLSESEMKFWNGEIEASQKKQKDEFLQGMQYGSLIEYFEGIQKGRAGNIEGLAIVDEYSPAIASVIATVYNQNPAVSVKALHPSSDKPIQVPLLFLLQNPDFQPFTLPELMDGALNHLIDMDTVNLKEEMQLAAFDLLTAGFAVVEMSHASVAIEQAQPGVPEQPQGVMQGLVQGAKDFGSDALKFVKDPLGVNKENALTTEQTEEKVASESKADVVGFEDTTYARRWCPTEILFDSRARRFKESRFIGKIIDKSVAEFKEMYPAFKDKVPTAAKKDLEFGSGKKEDDRKSVRFYELQVKQTDGLHIIVLGEGMTEALDHYILPFTTNGFTLKYKCLDKYGRIYPKSRAYKAKKNQDQINNMVTMQTEHALRSIRKIAYFEDGLTEQGKSNMRDADVYALVEKKIPGAVFERIPVDSVVVDNSQLQAVHKDNLNKQIGTTELAKSGQSENEFATQDVLQNQAFQTNTGQIQDALQDLADDVLNTAKDIVMQMWDDTAYFQVTGLKGGSFWYDPSMGPIADLMKGDFLVKTNMTTAMKANPLKDRQDAIDLAKFIVELEPYLNIKGKTASITPIENAIEQFGQNPDAILQDLVLPGVPGAVPGAEGMPVSGAQGLPPPAAVPTNGTSPDAVPAGLGGLV